MATNPADKYRHNAILEGGSSGSGGSGSGVSALELATKVGGPAALTFLGGAGSALHGLRKQQEASEAADELKRETRGVQKTATDRARDDAREMKMLEQADKASRAASRDMGMKKGGHVHHSEHYGKHAGGHKLHMDHVKAMCGGGYMKKAKK